MCVRILASLTPRRGKKSRSRSFSPDSNLESTKAVSPLADSVPMDETFEVFPDSLQIYRLPVVVFSADADEQFVWFHGTVRAGQVCNADGRPNLCITNPVVMSNAYKGFVIEPYEKRYLHYSGVGIVFSRPIGGRFMQPSIDTILVCRALLDTLRASEPSHRKEVRRIIDIGSGSGFLGKFAAVHAPGSTDLDVTLVDIDPEAMRYCRSPGFNAPDRGQSDRTVRWHLLAQDAIELLEKDSEFDLLVSNPPYIPTKNEAESSIIGPSTGGFWEGVGLVVYLLGLISSCRCSAGARLVMMVTSLTLKSPAVRNALCTACTEGARIRVLLEREIAWKAWYAGPSGLKYLLASEEEYSHRKDIAGCQFFIGATEPGNSRTGTDNRDSLFSYHWHVAYVLEVSRPS